MVLKSKIKVEALYLLLSTFFLKIVEFASIIVISRVLITSDFGLFGLTFAVNGLMAAVSNVGIGTYLVYKETVSDTLLSSAFWLNLFSGLVFTIVTMVCAPFLASFFGYPSLKNMLYVLALNIFFSSLIPFLYYLRNNFWLFRFSFA